VGILGLYLTLHMSFFVRILVLDCKNKCKASHAKKKAEEDKAKANSKYEEKKAEEDKTQAKSEYKEERAEDGNARVVSGCEEKKVKRHEAKKNRI